MGKIEAQTLYYKTTLERKERLYREFSNKKIKSTLSEIEHIRAQVLESQIYLIKDFITILESIKEGNMKESRINIRATQELKDRLNKICELEHRSQAQMIEHWIMAYKLPNKNPQK